MGLSGRAQVTVSQKWLEQLLAAGAAVSAADQEGRTPLHVAAAASDNAVLLLLAAGASVSAIDKDGRTPLHVAAAESRAAARYMLADDASAVATDNEGRTPLLLAIMADPKYFTDCARAILELGSVAPSARRLQASHIAAAQQPAQNAGSEYTAAKLAEALATRPTGSGEEGVQLSGAGGSSRSAHPRNLQTQLQQQQQPPTAQPQQSLQQQQQEEEEEQQQQQQQQQ